ncbi:MAG: aminotransferase class V-fold PLP-dependent enzyme [Terrimicrobiaceae bacterium]|jgi:selenocysteine lyase/cysteine desulfurase
MSWFTDENLRLDSFPVARERIFLAHAGVTILPRCAADAMRDHVEAACLHHQEFGDVLRDVARARGVCAKAIGAHADEIALLGPTSLGLGLFANGLDWKPGDEIVCHGDDYPSNVYPWMALASRGVVIRHVRPDVPGRITPDAVEAALTGRTRLVALASAHFLSGWRIDVDAIGKLLRSRGVLFSVDAIQTVGAEPFSVENVDFLSADAHKWMLGPLAIGIVYVARRNFELCRPTLLGAWNVRSPDFVAQKDIVFEETARRYEPGVLNITGMYGMKASLEMLLAAGLGNVRSSILQVRDALQGQMREMGFVFLSPGEAEPLRSGILTCRHPAQDSAGLFSKLEEAGIVASLRADRDGVRWIRFSPHYYNSLGEMDRVAGVLRAEIA